MKKRVLMVCLLLAATSWSQKIGTAEQRTSRYFESIRKQPPLLRAFLREMPKGGDLHNHLSGAISAESFIDYAAQDGLCVDRITSQMMPGPCESCEKYTNKPAVKCAYSDQLLYNTMLDAYSMRNWVRGEESGHDHFFASFGKFDPSTHGRTGDMLAETAARAAGDNLQYQELMITADDGRAAALGKQVGWMDNLSQLREKLLSSGLRDVITATRQAMDAGEKRRNELLRCREGNPDAGCAVTQRYLYQVLRGLAKEQVFTQILLGFELAKADPRFVGLNLVMPEDWYVPMHDFRLHMQMLGYLREAYPDVHLTLHAGELTQALVPLEGLWFHIRDSVEQAHAERIGHGVDVLYEEEPIELLKDMARRNILVEICLTSNDVILGVRGDQHPITAYRKYGVPVALATDDQGVSRGSMTDEYKRAAETYGFTYGELKQMARNSLEHGFLPGKSLWADGKKFVRAAGCAKDPPDAGRFSAACTVFLDENAKARVQWNLERAFARFEKQF